MDTATHQVIHSFIRSFIHRRCLHPCIDQPSKSFNLSASHSFVRQPFIHPLNSFTHQVIHSFVQSSTHPYIHPPIESFVRSCIHSFIHIHPRRQPPTGMGSLSVYPSAHPPFNSLCVHPSIHLFLHLGPSKGPGLGILSEYLNPDQRLRVDLLYPTIHPSIRLSISLPVSLYPSIKQ